MDWKVFATIFASIFVLELGDKSQIATMLFASEKEVNKYLVFSAASLALIVTTGLGVLAGGVLHSYIDEKYVSYVAGAGFIVIGIFTIYRA